MAMDTHAREIRRAEIAELKGKVASLEGVVASLRARLKSLNAGCNSYFSPDGIESVKCNIDHLCAECEPVSAAPTDEG